MLKWSRLVARPLLSFGSIKRSHAVLTGSTIRYNSNQAVETKEYAFMPRYMKKPPAEKQSSNPEYIEALIEERNERALPTIKKLEFKETGIGETPSSVRRLPEKELRKEVLVTRLGIKASPIKLNLLCKLVRGRTVEDALDQLRYSPKMWSGEVMKLIHQGVKKAELEHGLKREDLYVAVCFVTKGEYFRRINIHGKGRFGLLHIKHSHLNVILRDTAGEDVRKYRLYQRKLLKQPGERQRPKKAQKMEWLMEGLE